MMYTHLTPEERHTIETRHKLKDSTLIIAYALGRSQSTISRELKRNTGSPPSKTKRSGLFKPTNGSIPCLML